MISRLTGRVEHVSEAAAEVAIGGLCYEVLVPVSALGDLERLRGQDVTLFTVQYLEGNPAGSNFVPRLIGFLAESERDFFNAFVKVRGVSMRRALRSMSLPAHQLAAAIENGDERTLVGLPEIGKKTAAQIIADLRGKLTRFLVASAVPTPIAEMTTAQRLAADILVQWGDRRADAQRWIAAAIEVNPKLDEPDAIVRAAYRAKQKMA